MYNKMKNPVQARPPGSLLTGIKLCMIAPFVLSSLLLTACTQQENDQEQSFSSGTAESDTDAEKEINSPDPDTQQDVAADISNMDILAASAGTTVTQTIENSAGGVISIDAQVDVGGVSRVSRYRYLPLPFTEENRKALLKERFPAEDWDVNEAAVYNENEGVWELATPLGENWIFQTSASEIPGEQILNLERVDEKPDYAKENILSSVRISPELTTEDELSIIEITDSNSREIKQLGKLLLEAAAGMDTYSCSYIHICEDSGGHRYVRAVFKQAADGMPVTVWHNFSTVTSKTSLSPVKIWGSFYSMEEIGLDKPILTPEEAVAAMQEQIDSVQMQETPVHITKISLEYLAVISSEGTPEIVPVWRFRPGDDEKERNMLCEQILAVNAVSGELIWENRGAIIEAIL